MGKLVKENLNENIKLNNIEFKTIKTPNGIVYVGQNGILGHRDTLISWKVLKQLYKLYKHQNES